MPRDRISRAGGGAGPAGETVRTVEVRTPPGSGSPLPAVAAGRGSQASAYPEPQARDADVQHGRSPTPPDGAETDASPRGSARRWSRRAAVAGVIVVAVAAAYVASTTSLDTLALGSTAAPGVGVSAPSFTLPAAGGGTIALDSFRGKPVVVNFWATWCTPCRAELPELEMAWRSHRDAGLVVIAVSLDDAAAARDVPEFLQLGSSLTGPYTFPVALDVNQSQMRRWRLLGVPSTFFLDRKGVVRAVQPGAMDREVIARNLATILTPA